ncbi:hypothetical protein L2E82_25720 [Cichorium intybus]|uniref:Uncharacterized protein n=1 Tax=Cichorium intybus TaxID=13427 RepID=A0ACB9E4A1_CICIN|nr:hypothetical protein L2E82_25720 [Cichorium intybus]
MAANADSTPSPPVPAPSPLSSVCNRYCVFAQLYPCFLSDGQEKRLAKEIESIEKDTGFKLRVLAQNYPDTPGLTIKDLWQLDDRTIVFVANPTFGKVSISDILHPLLLLNK